MGGYGRHGSEGVKFILPPFSLIRDFSNQNACGDVSKISVNHADGIPCMAVYLGF